MTNSSRVYIQASASISASGFAASVSPHAVESVTLRMSNTERPVPVFSLNGEANALVSSVSKKKVAQDLDRVTRMALATAERLRQDMEEQNFSVAGTRGAVVIGSSRGATGLLERYILQNSLENTHPLPPIASPTTTAGNIASYVSLAHDDVLRVSMSMTCTSALMSLAVGMSFLLSGMADYALVGGAEAPLTPFSIAQMQALRIYTRRREGPYPCLPLAKDATENTFVLGEGAALFLLTTVPSQRGALRVVKCGFGRERISSPTALSADGSCLRDAMFDALAALPEEDRNVDLVIAHAPGTKLGDHAELAALKNVFAGRPLPCVISTKWYTGHTFGAAGGLGLALAVDILHERTKIHDFPYETELGVQHIPQNVKRILVNSAGFGGMAVSILVERDA
jgi:3-oxoacyl-[acyl-carrier-protein] synthase II